jgi:predicted small integral membrane protein
MKPQAKPQLTLLDLITDAGTKRLSHTKLWANVGYAAATAAFLKQAWMGTANADIWWAYLACVAGATTASKYLSMRYAASVNNTAESSNASNPA